MTAADLLNTNWSAMYDYPKAHLPHRAPVLAKAVLTNEHGVQYNARVSTNRTRKRWWITIENNHWLRLYLTTTSAKRAAAWIAALQEAR